MRVRHLLSLISALALAIVPLAGSAGAQVYSYADGVEHEVLSTDAKDPLFIQVADDGRVFWAEREGRIAVLHPDGTQDVAALLEVSANACNETWCPQGGQVPLEEGGLYSILLAEDFTTSGHLYAFRTIPESVTFGDDVAPGHSWKDDPVCFEPTCEQADNFGMWRLSRFTVDANSHLDLASEETILEVPAYWFACCHYGGNLEWLPDGTILLSTGDDMAATVGAYGQSTDYRSGNAEQSSMNPADRRGKTLRLNPDGSVPDGTVEGVIPNPYLATDADGVALRDADGQVITLETEHTTVADNWGADDGIVAFDPYVYSVGYKQPFRGTIHPYTGTAIFGEVGPDGFVPIPGRGPRGVEELNEIPFGGGVNHGWPRCAGDNDPYYPWQPVSGLPSLPFVGGVSSGVLAPFDCSQMAPSVLWYPHDVSERWPSLGSGGVTSAPSAFYRADNDGALRLPEAFNDTLMFMEESRSGIIAMPVTADGHVVVDESEWTIVVPPTGSLAAPTAPRGITGATTPARPIDATVGPDGALYIVEYGNGFYNGGGAKISRLKCAGCTDSMSVALGNTPEALQAAASNAANAAGLPIPAEVLVGLGLSALAFITLRRRASRI